MLPTENNLNTGGESQQQPELLIAAGFSASEAFPSQKRLLWISGLGPKLEKNVQTVDIILEKIINEPNEDKATTSKAERGKADCLLDVLLSLQDEDKLAFPFETENIKAIILASIYDVLISGSETSSTVLEWAMLEMLKNPRVMEKAQAESEDEKFYPERFVNSSVDFKGTNFEYIPFGGGRRISPSI
ncbi:Cytochrome P450, E-class, group I [Parasponia andersonii]|uniref:Cytochrome P450, E-class, group I n=1 Tax=Parasponia andersonii TaxID=3476 RepID=A0A2P5B3T2_PARAD|nr:Cytochrome P450, E-class, group I [Parasponia andersonii]